MNILNPTESLKINFILDWIVWLVSVSESYIMNVNLSEATNLKHFKFCQIWNIRDIEIISSKISIFRIIYKIELLFPLIRIVNVYMHPLSTYRTYRKRLEVRKHLMNISRKYNLFKVQILNNYSFVDVMYYIYMTLQ